MIQLTRLPKQLYFLGSRNRQGFQLGGCQLTNGIRVLPVWTTKNLAMTCQKASQAAQTVDAADRNQLIIEVRDSRQFDYVYIDSSSTEAIVCKAACELHSLDKSRLVDLRDFNSIWPIAKQFLGATVGEHVTETLVEEAWRQHQHLTLMEAVQEAVKLAHDLKHKWTGHMRCSPCGYLWRCRRSTPPARCPSCGDKAVVPVFATP